MPLSNVPEMMQKAGEGNYAVGYFESWNLESLQATLDAAEAARAPVIIGFNGELMTRAERVLTERLHLYGALGRAAAAEAGIPVGFIFNECRQLDAVRESVDAGYNIVMPIETEENDPAFPARARKISDYAHSNNVWVEAELGHLACELGGDWHADGGAYTDPQQAVDFVASTQVDLLAVSVGNAHCSIDSRQQINIEQLQKLSAVLKIPLVLHGGTGIADASLKEAVRNGISKVNYGTNLKLRFLDAVRKALNTSEENPHLIIGSGGDEDAMTAGRIAVRDAILEKMDLLGCVGKA